MAYRKYTDEQIMNCLKATSEGRMEIGQLMSKNIIDLINRQKSEVDDWKEIAETYQKMFEDSYSKYQAKVDELNSKLAKCQLDLHYSRKEVAREILSDLKKEVHNKATYTHAKDTYSFINLHTFDQIINEMIRRYEKNGNEET